MKKYPLFIFFLSLVAMSCVNGKGKIGSAVNPDTLNLDTLATLNPNGNDLAIIETMASDSFMNFFSARIDGNGFVVCRFSNRGDHQFVKLFDRKNCPDSTIYVDNVESRCVGVSIRNEGSDVNPVLFMVMEDSHAERISLYELSQGRTKSSFYTPKCDIIGFDSETTSYGDGVEILGVKADGSKFDINWRPVVEKKEQPRKNDSEGQSKKSSDNSSASSSASSSESKQNKNTPTTSKKTSEQTTTEAPVHDDPVSQPDNGTEVEVVE